MSAGGDLVDEHDLSGLSSPTLLVVGVTDALKTITDENVVTGSLDRETTWRVVGYGLDVATSRRLAEVRPAVDDIHRVVSAIGATWRARVVDSGSDRAPI